MLRMAGCQPTDLDWIPRRKTYTGAQTCPACLELSGKNSIFTESLGQLPSCSQFLSIPWVMNGTDLEDSSVICIMHSVNSIEPWTHNHTSTAEKLGSYSLRQGPRT